MTSLPAGYENIRVWEASSGSRTHPVHYVAFFNTADQPANLTAKWSDAGVAGEHSAVELWSGVRSRVGSTVKVTLPAHGTAIFQVSRGGRSDRLESVLRDLLKQVAVPRER